MAHQQEKCAVQQHGEELIHKAGDHQVERQRLYREDQFLHKIAMVQHHRGGAAGALR